MYKNFKSRGFTLIEMLVSIAIIVTTTTVVVTILASSFRGVNKSTVSEEVRQNGTGALGRITRTIQFAETFQGASEDGSTYDFDCYLSEEKKYKYIRVKLNSQTKTLSCANDDITIDSVSLLDGNKVKVNENSCVFTCLQESEVVPPVISVGFGLSQKNASGSDKSTSIFFSTSIKMRNL